MRGHSVNQQRFALLIRSLTNVPSRRDVLRGLGAAGLALGLARSFELAEAKKKKRKKRKKRKPKATPNEFGCLEVNDPCTSPEQCCSGVCEGKRCRAHDTGTCAQDLDVEICLAGTIEDALKVLCDNSQSCGCYRTTSGSYYCSAFLYNEGDTRCADCKTDADCVALGFPPEAACAQVSRGRCAGACPTGMACLVPCGTELPPSTS
jgi:hypothetical protein